MNPPLRSQQSLNTFLTDLSSINLCTSSFTPSLDAESFVSDLTGRVNASRTTWDEEDETVDINAERGWKGVFDSFISEVEGMRESTSGMTRKRESTG